MAFGTGIFANDLMRAVAFLSRIPVPDSVFTGAERPLAAVSRTFALAGILIALPAVAILASAGFFGADALLAATLAIATLVATTGALHEDGLADVADGFFGGHDSERRLEIMKDSRNGTFGTLALVLSVVIRIAALGQCAAPGLAEAIFAVLAAVAVARATMVLHWANLPAARAGGLAAKSGQPDTSAIAMNTLFAIAVLAIAAMVSGSWIAFLIAVPIGALATVVVYTGMVKRKIGGHTGDTIGAACQIAEIAALIALAIML